MDTALLAALPAWAMATLLLATRLGVMLWMAPPLHALPVPGTVRLLLVLGLSAALVPALGLQLARPVEGWWAALLGEALAGVCLGAGLLLALAGYAVAGRLLDVQIGFGMAQVYDPVSRTQLPVFSAFLPLAGVLLFVLADGHHALLRALAASLQLWPPAGAWHWQGAVDPLLRQAGAMAALGLALALPVVLALVLLDLAVGAVTRNLPQFNMLVLEVPAKVLAGLAALALWMPLAGPVAQRLHASLEATWSDTLRAGAVTGVR